MSAVLPFPVNNGKRVVVSGILRYLVERYGAENVTYILLDSLKGKAPDKSTMPCACTVLKQPGLLRQLQSLFWHSAVKREKSIQESVLFSEELGRSLQASVAGTKPDLIVCDTSRIGQFFETDNRPEGEYVLYMDDLFSIRYRRMLEVLERFPDAQLDVLGNFSRFIPAFARPVARAKLVQKLLLKAEQTLVESRERACVRWFDKVLLINSGEANLLRRRTGSFCIRTIKPMLGTPASGTRRGLDQDPEFVFLGDLGLPHNRFSIVHFITTQMDQIIKEIPGVKLRIIGKGGDEEFLKLIERYEAFISYEGFVDDLSAVLDASCAMIVPLLFGSGVKIKTLEALSRGLPVLSTSYGVEGISVTHGVDCLVEDNIENYPGLMLGLTDFEYNGRLSEGARDLYFEDYSKERVFREYDLLFGGG